MNRRSVLLSGLATLLGWLGFRKRDVVITPLLRDDSEAFQEMRKWQVDEPTTEQIKGMGRFHDPVFLGVSWIITDGGAVIERRDMGRKGSTSRVLDPDEYDRIGAV